MRDATTTLLDALGLLLVAAGTGYATDGFIVMWTTDPDGLRAVAAGVGMFLAGSVLLLGSWVSDRAARVDHGGDDG